MSFRRYWQNQNRFSAAVVFEPSFATYVAKPNSKTMIDIGAAQVRLLRNAFAGLFSKLEFVCEPRRDNR